MERRFVEAAPQRGSPDAENVGVEWTSDVMSVSPPGRHAGGITGHKSVSSLLAGCEGSSSTRPLAKGVHILENCSAFHQK